MFSVYPCEYWSVIFDVKFNFMLHNNRNLQASRAETELRRTDRHRQIDGQIQYHTDRDRQRWIDSNEYRQIDGSEYT